jgi:hypothetical protein
MKPTTYLLGLSLAAALAVPPAGAQNIVHFMSTPVLNACNRALVLRPAGRSSGITIGARDSKVIDNLQVAKAWMAMRTYVPDQGLEVHPGRACKFDDCITTSIALVCGGLIRDVIRFTYRPVGG